MDSYLLYLAVLLDHLFILGLFELSYFSFVRRLGLIDLRVMLELLFQTLLLLTRNLLFSLSQPLLRRC